jgi:hypothetical protein
MDSYNSFLAFIINCLGRRAARVNVSVPLPMSIFVCLSFVASPLKLSYLTKECFCPLILCTTVKHILIVKTRFYRVAGGSNSSLFIFLGNCIIVADRFSKLPDGGKEFLLLPVLFYTINQYVSGLQHEGCHFIVPESAA